MVGRLPFTGVTDGVVDVGGLEDDGARSEFDPVAGDERLDGALLHNEQLFISVLVGRVRCLARIQRRDMIFKFVEGGGRGLANLAVSADLGRLDDQLLADQYEVALHQCDEGR